MQWVRFSDRWPPPTINEGLCAQAGKGPFMYHWRTDADGFTDDAGFMWLEGFRYPPVPTLADCCCKRTASA